MTFPEPVIGLAVEPRPRRIWTSSASPCRNWLRKTPTFTVHTDEGFGPDRVISGMGELHLDIIVDRLRREFGVEINQGAPQVNYKESLYQDGSAPRGVQEADRWPW